MSHLLKVDSHWRNLSTGKTYVVRGFVTNATNGPADGETMVLYSLPGFGLSHAYVREAKQFRQCFEEVV